MDYSQEIDAYTLNDWTYFYVCLIGLKSWFHYLILLVNPTCMLQSDWFLLIIMILSSFIAMLPSVYFHDVRHRLRSFHIDNPGRSKEENRNSKHFYFPVNINVSVHYSQLIPISLIRTCNYSHKYFSSNIYTISHLFSFLLYVS